MIPGEIESREEAPPPAGLAPPAPMTPNGTAVPPSLPARFHRHLEESALLAGARTVVVACSGGGDSTALLLLLAETAGRDGIVLVPAHVGHGLRGIEGHLDARFAADLAAGLGLPFVYRDFDVRSLRAEGESLEAAGRRVRYETLLALSRDLGPGTLVATGHTLDDQAETVLMNLQRHLRRSRGGIRSRRDDGVVRPLLPFTRAELRPFLVERGTGWREDASNRDERFLRNRIRHGVLPRLEASWPGTAARLARAATAWTERLDRLDARVDEALSSSGSEPGGPWPRALFRALGAEASGRLLVRACASRGRVPGRVQVERAVKRTLGPEERANESLGGGRLATDRFTVRLLSADRLQA